MIAKCPNCGNETADDRPIKHAENCPQRLKTVHPDQLLPLLIRVREAG